MTVKRKKKNRFGDYLATCEDCGAEFWFPLESGTLILCNGCLTKRYREDLQLDKHSLDEHMEEQHLRFEKWCALLTEMKDLYYAADQMVKTERARIDSEIRLCEPDSLEGRFGLSKLSEAAINGAIERHGDYLETLSLLRAARTRKDLLEGCVEAFRDRRSMLKYLTELYVAQYYDRSQVSRSRVEETIAKHTRVPRREKEE